MKYFKAGYYAAGVKKLFENDSRKETVDLLLENLAYFSVATETELATGTANPIISVARNFICTGVPGVLSAYAEERLANVYGKPTDNTNLNFNFPDKLKDNILAALHIIDSRITIEFQAAEYSQRWDKMHQEFADTFNYSHIPAFLGNYFLQIPQRNVSIEDISPWVFSDLRSKISNKNKAFVFDFPYPIQNKTGLVIEIEETEPTTAAEKKQISMEEKFFAELGYQYFRIAAHRPGKVSEAVQPIKKLLDSEFFYMLKTNYSEPLHNSENGMAALQLALTPLAIARLQLTLLEFIASGKLSLNDLEWRIAVIERDVPCAEIAINDFKQLLENLFTLEGKFGRVPQIVLEVFSSKTFRNAELHPQNAKNIKYSDDFNSEKVYDLLLDISVLRRANLVEREFESKARLRAEIRSSAVCGRIPRVENFVPIKFPEFINKPGGHVFHVHEKAAVALAYFTQRIFRREKFTNQQLAMLNKLMQMKSVLATGSPRTDATQVYMLASLMQPSYTLLILPTKSASDKYCCNFKKYGFSKPLSLESFLQNPEYGRTYSGIMVSEAEFLYKAEFPELLKNLPSNVSFSFAVVEEAERISEHSTERNPYYIGLNKRIQAFFPSKGMLKLPIAGIANRLNYLSYSDVTHEYGFTPESIIELNNPDIYFELLLSTTGAPADKAIEYQGIKENLLAEKIKYANNKSGADIIVYPENLFLANTDRLEKQTGEDKIPEIQVSNPHLANLGDFYEPFLVSVPSSLEEMLEIAGMFSFIKTLEIKYSPHKTKAEHELEHILDDGSIGEEITELEENFDFQFSFERLKKQFPGREKEVQVADILLKGIPSETDEKASYKGILEVQSGKPDTVYTLEFPLTNDSIARISKFLNKYASAKFTPEYVQKCYHSSSDASGFLFELNLLSDVFVDSQGVYVPGALRKMYKEIYTLNDLLIAVLRLQVLGMVQTFFIDKKNNKLIISGKTEKPENYFVNLYAYLSRYFLPFQAGEVFRNIEKYPGKSIYEKLVYYLIDFIYNHTFAFKVEQIKQMERFMDLYDKQGAAEANTYLIAALKAKFVHRKMHPNLDSDTDGFIHSNFETVLATIRKTLCCC